MIVHTCSVGASGSSPALSPATTYIWWHPQRGWIAFPRCMYCGRPSSRPYSYAVERCGDLQCIIMDCPYSYAVERLDDFQCIINDCPYRQCRGEWKLARVATTDACTCWAASPEGMICVFAWFVLRATFQSPLQLRGGLRGDLQGIIKDCPCGYAVERWGDLQCIINCPLQLRGWGNKIVRARQKARPDGNISHTVVWS